MYTKESLERLKQKIDLVELLSSYLDLKKAGASYKALCPFHDENSPSFMLGQSDTHYHCFGCGAHGDAIQFLMTYLNVSFQDAVEQLAQRFQVPLDIEDAKHPRQDLAPIKEALQVANQFFHYMLLYSRTGHGARRYLYERGLNPDFIKQFTLGFAPEQGDLFRKVMHEHRIKNETLQQAGLINKAGRDFFQGRITFPICNAFGQIIGFSARKIAEETFGGKYINTSETPLFKKSSVLFGLHYSRRRIAKQQCAILVEGQIDCLRLIEAGLNMTVAALGTAFGKGHAEQIQKLGVKRVYLLFDADKAGEAASSKVGDIFQHLGVDVLVARLPKGQDPDIILKNSGMDQLVSYLESAQDYLTFQVAHLGSELDLLSPAAKSSLVNQLKKQVEAWSDPLMVHESLKKVAQLTDVPEEMVRTQEQVRYTPAKLEKKRKEGSFHRVLEMDLLRWLILKGGELPSLVKTANHYLTQDHFFNATCKEIFVSYLEQVSKTEEFDFLSLMIDSQNEKTQDFIDQIMQKRVNQQKAEDLFLETVQKLCDRKWMYDSEQIKQKIHDHGRPQDEVLELAKEFDLHKKNRLEVVMQSE